MPNNHFSDTRLVSGDWFGNYNFKIAMETHEFKSKNLAHHFVTEKTFKRFIFFCFWYLKISLCNLQILIKAKGMY